MTGASFDTKKSVALIAYGRILVSYEYVKVSDILRITFQAQMILTLERMADDTIVMLRRFSLPDWTQRRGAIGAVQVRKMGSEK